MSVLAAQPTLEDFGHDVWWIVLIKIVAIFVILVVMTLFAIVLERKVVARMQQRLGPNRVGPRGYLQSLADGLKLAFKEDIMPLMADRPVYFLAPVIAAVPAFLAFSVIPLGPTVSIGGHHTALQLTDAPIGVLIVLACSAMGVYGIVLAGWASGSTYPLLGGLRSAAQMVSYEVGMALAIVPVFIYSGSLSTSDVVNAQSHSTDLVFFGHHVWGPSWYAVLLPVSFVIYAIAVVGETNRAPFDLPEAESELVGGFHTEYSSLKFALFFLAEYINMVTVSALATTLFLGGWRAPWPISIWPAANTGWWPLIWFFLKVLVALFFFIWLRGTLPRLRYDQFMRFGWKVLVPTGLVWILIVAAMRTAARSGQLSSGEVAVYIGIPIALIVIVALLVSARVQNRETRLAAKEAASGSIHPTEPEEPEVLPPVGPRHRPARPSGPSRAEGGFPIPPMDLVVPPSPRLRRGSAVAGSGVVGTGRRGTGVIERAPGPAAAESPASEEDGDE